MASHDSSSLPVQSRYCWFLLQRGRHGLRTLSPLQEYCSTWSKRVSWLCCCGIRMNEEVNYTFTQFSREFSPPATIHSHWYRWGMDVANSLTPFPKVVLVLCAVHDFHGVMRTGRYQLNVVFLSYVPRSTVLRTHKPHGSWLLGCYVHVSTWSRLVQSHYQIGSVWAGVELYLVGPFQFRFPRQITGACSRYKIKCCCAVH